MDKIKYIVLLYDKISEEYARVVKLVDTLLSEGSARRVCEFESHRAHKGFQVIEVLFCFYHMVNFLVNIRKLI